MKTAALLPAVFAIAVAISATGCGKPPPPPPDAGVDDSCGLDCAAQSRYGLILQRCFEYSASATAPDDPPALGVFVSEKRPLEGDVPVISVDYSQAGARKMTDSFTIRDGKLILARREWTSGGSVTYKDASGAIIGSDYLLPDTAAGQNFATTTVADFISGGMRVSDDTTFTVVASAPTATDKKVPAGTYDDAVKLLVNEQPTHFMDSRRIFVGGTGFITIATSLTAASTATSTPYYLQGIRDLGTADGGTHACGLTP